MMINGNVLTDAQAATVRVALEHYSMCRGDEGLGEDEHGRHMTAAYLARIDEIRAFLEQQGAPC